MNIYLGENESGRIIKSDLREVKHLLVVGKTGTGKTEFLHAIAKNLSADYGFDKIKFCLLSDVWFGLQSAIPTEYFLFGKEQSVAKDETEAGALLDRILSLIAERENDTTKGNAEIVFLCDENAFYHEPKNNEKIAEIIKRGNAVGVHIVYSLQNVRSEDKEMLGLFPSVLCGALCDDRQTKLILGAKTNINLKPFEFILKTETTSEVVRNNQKNKN